MHERKQRQARHYDWAAVGKTAEPVAWHQLVMAEGLDANSDEPRSQAIATALLDLVKFFEKRSSCTFGGRGVTGAYPELF